MINAIIELEEVHSILKIGIVIPAYKSGGKDPLTTDSYRGFTFSSMLAKVLKFLLFDRLQLVFLLAGLPHPVD